MSFFPTKSLDASVKDVDIKNRQVAVYFSAFEKVDSDKERTFPSSFQKTFKDFGPQGKNRVWHLADHTPSLFSAIGKPIELGVDNFGAFGVTKVSNKKGTDDILTLYDEKMITEHSFGYNVVKAEMTEIDGEQVRDLKELIVYEYSSVLWGANEFTPTRWVKSMEDFRSLDERIKEWSGILRKGNLTDEFCELLEIQLKQLAHEVDTLKSSLEKAAEPTSISSQPSTPIVHEPGQPPTREDKEPDEQVANLIALWGDTKESLINSFSNLTRETWNHQNSLKN